jgi:hypothetical protein
MGGHKNHDKIAHLRELGFADPVKMITSRPAILRNSIDNMRVKIADLRELGVADPVKMITSRAGDPRDLYRQHPRQDRRPGRARLRQAGEDDHIEPGDPRAHD